LDRLCSCSFEHVSCSKQQLEPLDWHI